MKICNENKVKEFYFKLLHRILVSKKELCYFGVEKDRNCNYCGHSIKHTFIECHHTKAFFQNVLVMFNKEHYTTFTLCDIEMIFGKTLPTVPLPCKISRNLNYSILYAKYYLYNKNVTKRS